MAFFFIDFDDDYLLFLALIASVRLHVEAMTGRALVEQTWRLSLTCAPLLVELPAVPAIALVAAPDGAALQGDAVLLAEAGGDVTIDYTAGYGDAADVPADLKQAVLTLVAYWYENRDALTAPPLGFDRLIAGYRRVRL